MYQAKAFVAQISMGTFKDVTTRYLPVFIYYVVIFVEIAGHSPAVKNLEMHRNLSQHGHLEHQWTGHTSFFQSFDVLSRKSSAGSTGSLDRSEFLLEKAESRCPFLSISISTNG
jgi:hypothetical protein